MTMEVQISGEVLVRYLQGESVLLDLKSQRYYGLDEIGTRMWQLLEEHGEPQPVLERMLEEFDVERPRLEKDLEAFLSKLEAAELVTVLRPPEGAADGGAAQAP